MSEESRCHILTSDISTPINSSLIKLFTNLNIYGKIKIDSIDEVKNEIDKRTKEVQFFSVDPSHRNSDIGHPNVKRFLNLDK